MTTHKSNRRLSNRSRKIARERFWGEHDKSSYSCPDCGRRHGGGVSIEVHHKQGEVMDNRLESLVGLCRVCHALRESRKPAYDWIAQLRDDHAQTSGISFSSDLERFVDSQVCFCGEEGHDDLSEWATLYDFSRSAGRRGTDARTELVSLFNDLPDTDLSWQADGTVIVNGPSRRPCDCFTMEQWRKGGVRDE